MRINDIILAEIDINLIIHCKYNQIYIKLLHWELKASVIILSSSR